jgi:hypothetical protein
MLISLPAYKDDNSLDTFTESITYSFSSSDIRRRVLGSLPDFIVDNGDWSLSVTPTVETSTGTYTITYGATDDDYG